MTEKQGAGSNWVRALFFFLGGDKMMDRGKVVGQLIERQARALFTLARLLTGDRENALAQLEGLAYILEALSGYTLILADGVDSVDSAERKDGDSDGD